MALTFFWRCETDTLSGTDDYTAGDNTASYSNSAELNAVPAHIGTNSLDAVASTGSADFVLSSDIVLSEGSVGFWFYYDADWQAAQVWRALDASTPNDRLQVTSTGSSGSGEVRLRIGADGAGEVDVVTTGANLADATWYFVVARWDETSTTGRVEVYNTSLVEQGTAGENTSVGAQYWPAFANIDLMQCLGGFRKVHADNIMVSDTYGEALEDYANYTSYTQYGASPGQVILVPKGPRRNRVPL